MEAALCILYMSHALCYVTAQLCLPMLHSAEVNPAAQVMGGRAHDTCHWSQSSRWALLREREQKCQFAENDEANTRTAALHLQHGTGRVDLCKSICAVSAAL